MIHLIKSISSKTCFIAGAITWLLLLSLNLLIVYGLNANPSIDFAISNYINTSLLILFFLFVFLYQRISVDNLVGTIIELLQKLLVTGVLTVIVSFLLKFFLWFIEGSSLSENPFLLNLFYYINIILITIFITKTFFIWKKLVFYHKTKKLLIIWQVFEVAIVATLILSFLNFHTSDTVFLIVSVILIFYGIFLSINVKWVAYLNLNQKLKSMLLIFCIVMIGIAFFYSIPVETLLVSPLQNNPLFIYNSLSINVAGIFQNIFIAAILTFFFIYGISSLLVLLFNLPTSSVVEQKFQDILNFHKLGQSIQSGKDETQVYNILLESSMKAVAADAAWVDITDDEGETETIVEKDITLADMYNIKNILEKSYTSFNYQPFCSNNLKKNKYYKGITKSEYNSLLIIPIYTHNQRFGTFIMLKEIKGGFDNDMINITKTFVSQASVSLENLKLISEALVNERYKQELIIADKVQKSLLPDKLISNGKFEIQAFSQAASEVGGDFYDIYSLPGKRVAIVIGDVSGKGTSAAFNMAQMKGIFQSLIQLDLPPDKFMIYANNALSNCLERSSFITLSLFIIDTMKQKIIFARAGHCPSLFYDSTKKETKFLQNQGLGLGILRNNKYASHINNKQFNYSNGDVLLLYTDGITEAKNTDNEEYGYDRLKDLLDKSIDLNCAQIIKNITEDLYDFCKEKHPDDDFSVLVIKL